MTHAHSNWRACAEEKFCGRNLSLSLCLSFEPAFSSAFLLFLSSYYHECVRIVDETKNFIETRNTCFSRVTYHYGVESRVVKKKWHETGAQSNIHNICSHDEWFFSSESWFRVFRLTSKKINKLTAKKIQYTIVLIVYLCLCPPSSLPLSRSSIHLLLKDYID